MSKNILICTGIFPPAPGGPATYSAKLLRGLPAFGFGIQVITYGEQKQDNVMAISNRQNILARYWKYFRAVKEKISQTDIVYIQGPVSEGLPSYLACRLAKKKYILKIVGDYAWEQGTQRFGVKDNLDNFQNKKYGWQVELMRMVQKKVAKGARLIIVPSEYLKKIVSGWGVDMDKIKVIYNSVPDINLSSSKTETKIKLDLDGDIIFSCSRLVPWKGFLTLIDLMPDLLLANPRFKLIIGGAGPDFNVLKAKINNLQLEKNVFLLGGLEHEEVLSYVRAADMFVLNTGYEGLSHHLIEAAQIGTPIITTRVGGNPEVVADGETGLLVGYDDKKEIKAAIIKLWHNRQLANELVDRAKKMVREKFNEEKMLADLVKYLEI